MTKGGMDMAKTEQGFIIPDGVTGDLIVFTKDFQQVVLIDRKNKPFGKALPGGFLDPNETLSQCAAREFLEECNVSVEEKDVTLIGVYSDPKRDPRARIISAAYAVHLTINELKDLQASDDALSVKLYDIKDIAEDKIEFAFSDHQQMIKDALSILKSKTTSP